MKRFFLTLLLLAAFGGITYWMGRASVRPSAPETNVGPKAAAAYPVLETAAKPESESGFTPAQQAPVTRGATPVLDQLNTELTGVIAAVQPSVVNLELGRKLDLEELAKELPGLPPGSRTLTSVGSGVIVSHEGHIITNAHVVAAADDILVTLYDDREYPAQLVGIDVLSDIAVLRIDADELQPLPWGNSEEIRIGEMVLALGNPLANKNSVSTGIISAIGRHDSFDGFGRYENYIQTDASVNPGNSGGALVNLRGELIGINTAIATRSGGFEGISYAIPSDLARFSVEGLLKDGRVIRGFLGVAIDNVDGAEAEALQIEPGRGVMVVDVRPKTPAERAHLKRFDVITAFNGEPVRNVSELRLEVSLTPVGREVPIEIYRDGEKRSIPVSVDEMPEDPALAALQMLSGKEKQTASEGGEDDATVATTQNVFAGLNVKALDDATRKAFQMKPEQTGVVVEALPAGWKDLPREYPAKGDVLTDIRTGQGKSLPLSSPEEFRRIVANIAPAQAVHVVCLRLNTRDNRVSSRISFLQPQE